MFTKHALQVLIAMVKTQNSSEDFYECPEISALCEYVSVLDTVCGQSGVPLSENQSHQTVHSQRERLLAFQVYQTMITQPIESQAHAAVR